MRFDFRKAFAWFAAASLIFWCSCERHHVGELPNEHATTETKATTEQHDAHSDQPAAMSPHSHTAQTPEPRNSPANFFPERIHVQTLPRYCTVGALVRLLDHLRGQAPGQQEPPA